MIKPYVDQYSIIMEKLRNNKWINLIELYGLDSDIICLLLERYPFEMSKIIKLGLTQRWYENCDNCWDKVLCTELITTPENYRICQQCIPFY